MGTHKQIHPKDFYPLNEAARIAHTLTNGERMVEPSQRWAYIMMIDKKKPDLAAVAVYDETDKFVGWWCC